MKQFLICLIFLMLPSLALANSWNAPGGTLTLFADNDDYADYTCVAEDYSKDEPTAQLIMSSRYHNQLILAEQVGREWRMTQTSTTAVYQPSEENAKQAKLERTPAGFILSYPGEEYEFALVDGDWTLQYAWVNGLSFLMMGDGRVMIEDSGSRVVWQIGEWWDEDAPLTLDRFNINLFPRSLEEVRRANALRALIADSGWLISEPVVTPSDNSYPVYSAPSADSWRAAEGKASVSLRDIVGLSTFGEVDGWQLIEYRVSLRTNRIGYIEAETEAMNDPLCHIAVVTRADTWLTDDPGVSQYQQMTIPAGTTLTALDCYGLYYAYVETIRDGQTIRGFVPLRDLSPKEDSDSAPEALLGAWSGRGWPVVGSEIVFGEIGRYTSYDDEMNRVRSGRWYVTACPAERFDDADYALMLVDDDGRALYLGLVFYDDGIILRTTEGGLLYSRVEPTPGAVAQDMMALIAGSYDIAAGGSMIPGDSFTLNADGTIETNGTPSHTGTWFVTRYNPAEGYIWTDPDYTLYVTLDNGYDVRLGCSYEWLMGLDAETYGRYWTMGLELSHAEGSGGYLRTDAAFDEIVSIVGVYDHASGDALLSKELRLLPTGELFIDVNDDLSCRGLWALEPQDGGKYVLALYFHTDSPVHAGEVLRLNYTLDSGTLTLSNDEGTGMYTWREDPGYG